MNEQQSNSIIHGHFAKPLVDLATATRESKQRIHARRKAPDVIEGKKAVIDKHASRKSTQSRKKSSSPNNLNTSQLGFDF
jgi:deoxyribodipyrimidine photo-lyase